MTNIQFCFLFLTVSICVLHLSKASEPACSQFDKDRKLMEFMTETRHEVKEMAKDLRRTEEYLLAVLEHRKEEMKKLKEDINDRLEDGMHNITGEVDDLKGRVENVEVPMVAFSAHNPVDKSLQTNEILILKSILLNEGDAYDTKTGIFTAPVGGLYYFTAHICNVFQWIVHYALVKDNDKIARSQQFEQASENSYKYGSCSSVSALTKMEPGEKVWIECTSGYSSVQQIQDDSSRRNSFIGVLLRK